MWAFFKDPTENSAICKICLDKSISIAKARVVRYNNTVNLWRHLDDNHLTDEVWCGLNIFKNNSNLLLF